jgi:predicted permease
LEKRTPTLEIFAGGRLTSADCQAIERAKEAFDSVACFHERDALIEVGGKTRPFHIALFSAPFFNLVSARVRLGRLSTDPVGSAAPSAVISAGFWRSVLGGRADVLQQQLKIKGQPYTIAAVIDDPFHGVDDSDVSVWFPIDAIVELERDDNWLRAPNVTWLEVIARRRPGVNRPQAAEIVRSRVMGEPGLYGHVDVRAILSPLHRGFGPGSPPAASVSAWFLFAALLLLCAAITNVAGVILARELARLPEHMVRAALGEPPAHRLARMLVQNGMISLMGLLLGTGLLLLLQPGRLVSLQHGAEFFDWRLLSALAIVTIATVAFLTLATFRGLQRHVSFGDLARLDGYRLAAGPRTYQRVILLQIAFDIFLMTQAGMFLRTLRRLQEVDLGFEPARLIAVFPVDRDSTMSSAILERLSAAARHVGGVAGAAATSSIPFQNQQGLAGELELPYGSPRLNGLLGAYVDADYFSVAGVPIVHGRGISADDLRRRDRTAVISETIARKYWGDANPIGSCIRIATDVGASCFVIVGVAANGRYFDLDGPPTRFVFLPATYAPASAQLQLLVRTRLAAQTGVDSLRSALEAVWPSATALDIEPLSALMRPSTETAHSSAVGFAVLSGGALLLLALGCFGVVSHEASSRRHDIGVRLALGATPSRVLGTLLIDTGSTAAVGLFIGILLSRGGSQLMMSRLPFVQPADLPVFIVVIGTVLGVTAVTALIPAWRAISAHPIDSLRSS